MSDLTWQYLCITSWPPGLRGEFMTLVGNAGWEAFAFASAVDSAMSANSETFMWFKRTARDSGLADDALAEWMANNHSYCDPKIKP